MTPMDVQIVGGGVVGVACARALASRGVTVRVLTDRKPGGQASLAAAGMLAPLVEIRHDDPLVGIYVRARDFYRDLVPELTERTGMDIGLWSPGIFQLAYSDEHAAKLKQEIAWQRQQGYASDWLSPEELQEYVPGVAEGVTGALHAPEDGGLVPEALVAALTADAQAHGALFEETGPVERIEVDNGVAIAVQVKGGSTFAAQKTVIAAGCWSGQIQGLPRPLSVEPIRGQMVALPWPEGQPPSIVYGDMGYVVHRGGEALIGSTMEYAGFDSRTTPHGIARVMEAARRIFPAFADAVPKRSWAGLRPVTPDGAPIVGADPQVEGLWYATGHGRNGILMAGLTGDIIAKMMLEDFLDYDMTPMNPGRFWRF